METGVQASQYGGIQRFDKREHLAGITAARPTLRERLENLRTRRAEDAERAKESEGTWLHASNMSVLLSTEKGIYALEGLPAEELDRRKLSDEGLTLYRGRESEFEALSEEAKEAWREGADRKPPTERQAASRATAAKVCGLANKLSKDMTRKEAFAKAWAIVRNGGIELPVAGTSFRQEAIVRLFRYDPKDVLALLVPEPENRHDPEAIAVKVMVNGGKGIYTLGYVPRADTKVARAFLGAVPELRLIDGETKGARIRLAA